MKGPQRPSDTRKLNLLARLINEHGAAHASKLFARALKEQSRDPMAPTIASHLLMGVVRAETEAS